jgi:DNA-directed RNA polymerase subunit RPC12/RpoP
MTKPIQPTGGDALREAVQIVAKHFPLIGDFGNVTGCEECDWKPTKILGSRTQFIGHIEALAPPLIKQEAETPKDGYMKINRRRTIEYPECVHGIIQMAAIVCARCNPEKVCELTPVGPECDYLCSYCKHDFTYVGSTDPDGLLPHFCPHCGSKKATSPSWLAAAAKKHEADTPQPSDLVSKKLVLDWLTGYAGPQEPDFFGEFLEKLEWRIANEAAPQQELERAVVQAAIAICKSEQRERGEIYGDWLANHMALMSTERLAVDALLAAQAGERR